jgi:hypothetical protein
VRRFADDRRGSVGIVFALALVPLLAAAGAALDYSRAAQTRAALQAVVDAAVLSGLKATASQRIAAAEAHARQALAAQKLAIDQVSFTPTANQGLRGRVKVRLASLFGNLLGTDGIGVAAGAEGFVRAAPPAGGNVCLMLMDPSAAETLRVNGAAKVTAPNCEVHVHTAANVGAVFNGNGTFDVKRICLRGPGYIANGSPKLGPIEKGCAVAADPYALTLPKVADLACTFTNRTFNASNGAPTELEPGVYCGATRFNGAQEIRLKPGLYVIKDGTMSINGGSSISGSGVTFYLANAQSDLRLNGAGTTRLSAPSAAADPYHGILMFEPRGLARTSMAFNGGAGHRLEGLIHLPSRNVTFNGASTLGGENVTMVFNALLLNGAGEWRFDTAAKAIKAPSSAAGAAEIILQY